MQAVVSRGAYDSPEEVVEAALAVIEQRSLPGFEGSTEALDGLLAEGVASRELSEENFWSSVKQTTDAMLVEHKSGTKK